MADADAAVAFLRSIPEIGMNETIESDVRKYAASDVYYPKRYKIRSHVYFIMIKTEAASMQDFKQKKALRPRSRNGEPSQSVAVAASSAASGREGWYEGTMDFKRVVLSAATGKYEYRDTHFVAACKASSNQECYDRIVDHLRGRVDRRSQFPSIKGKNFRCRYLGECK